MIKLTPILQTTLYHLQNSLLDFIRDIHLLQKEHFFELIQSVDVSDFAPELVANDGLEQNHHHADEVSRVDDVQLLQVLLVPVYQCVQCIHNM